MSGGDECTTGGAADEQPAKRSKPDTVESLVVAPKAPGEAKANSDYGRAAAETGEETRPISDGGRAEATEECKSSGDGDEEHAGSRADHRPPLLKRKAQALVVSAALARAEPALHPLLDHCVNVALRPPLMEPDCVMLTFEFALGRQPVSGEFFIEWDDPDNLMPCHGALTLQLFTMQSSPRVSVQWCAKQQAQKGRPLRPTNTAAQLLDGLLGQGRRDDLEWSMGGLKLPELTEAVVAVVRGLLATQCEGYSSDKLVFLDCLLSSGRCV